MKPLNLTRRINNLESFKILRSTDRNSSIDIFRAIAIIMVVLYHYNDTLPFGNIGVDLFFVISGLLVGGLLTKAFARKEQIGFFKFFVQRGFKIWPSYYFFLVTGTIIAYFLYQDLSPDQVIPLWDFKRYLFFYQNYTGLPFHRSFDHVWSLCVEEHFYILLPIMFIVVQRFFNRKEVLFSFVGLVIVMGVVFKVASVLYTNSKDTYAGTLVRLDALAWGVMLNLVLVYYPRLLKHKRAYLLFILGLGLCIAAVAVYYNTNSFYYKKVVFHSLLPFCFFLQIAGLYHFNLSRLKAFRVVAYYSYNWYLWHPLFSIFLAHYIGNNILGLSCYLLLSFSVAVICTIVVEETFLKWRKPVIDRLFRRKLKYSVTSLES